MSISWYKMWFLFLWIFITLLLLSSPPFSPIANSQELNMIEGSIKKGDTFSQSLTRKKISLRWIDLIVSKLSRFIDFRYLKEASYQFITDEKGELVKL